jgi:hypothetical protein
MPGRESGNWDWCCRVDRVSADPTGDERHWPGEALVWGSSAVHEGMDEVLDDHQA